MNLHALTPSNISGPPGAPMLTRQADHPECTLAAGATTVLLIEDLDDVREPNAAALERAGYHVVQASSWGHALAVSERERPRVDVILTDLVMPDDAGVDTFGQLRGRHGSVPVIVLSAYPAAMRLLGGVLDGVVAWLQKPTEVSHVVEAVDRALGRVPG
jgi:DNA-binding NtrC family response regulator